MNLNESNFQKEVIDANVPVLIDLWAPWCGPCNAMSPIMDELESEFKDRAKIAKINVDEQSELASRHGISAIPAFILYKNGAIKKMLVGIQTLSNLRKQIEDVIND